METDPESTAEIKSQDMQRDDTEVQEEREQSEILQEDEILSVNQHSKYLDHCSLSLPSSQIRFRGTSKARIYPDARGQFILEEDGNKKTAKWVETSGAKLRFLRFLYTLVAAFWTGFLVVLSIMVLLYLVLDITIASGLTNKQEQGDFGQFVGAVLAFPLYVYGMASALVLAGHFVLDTWSGHLLVTQFVYGNVESVLMEWITFWVYLGIPLFTLIICILAKLDNFWEITCLVWFTCISVDYVVFSVVVVYYEIRANWEVTKNRWNLQNDSYWGIARRAILLRQRHVFGGVEKSTYLLKGEMTHEDDASDEEGDHLNVRQSSKAQRRDISSGKTWYCHFISLKIFQKLGMFVPTEGPERQYNIADVQDARSFVTRSTWTLESVYCRPRSSRLVAVLSGPEAITQQQIHSSVVCAGFANLFYILLLAAFLRWLGLDAGAAVIVGCIFVLLVLVPSLWDSYRIYKLTKEQIQYINEDEEVGSKEERNASDDGSTSDSTPSDSSEAIFQVWESHRVITLTETFCWALFAIEVIFLCLWPLISLISLGNVATTLIFVVICGFSFMRCYFNAAIVLEETGTMNLVDGEKGTPEYWQNISRLNTIVTKVTRSHARSIWLAVLLVFLILMLVFAVSSAGTTPVSGENVGGYEEFVTYLPDYKYEGNDATVPYPSCSFGIDSFLSGIDSFRSNTTQYTRRDLADYAFLSSLAYASDNITQTQLDQWFAYENAVHGNRSKVMNLPDDVLDFRQSIGSQSPVVYKAISFPASFINDEHDIMVTVRGSANPFDFLTDAQLWFPAVLFQCLRFLLPAGYIWTPIMHNLIETISWLESASLEKISFYKETTSFIEWIKTTREEQNVTNIQITGHSLGGGLALISAAQAKVPGIGVSAPNAMLGRTSYTPPLNVTDLNELTFNIVPDNDIVPRCDDLAQNYQKTRCTADTGTFFGDAVACHGNGLRTLCELLYQCGTANRPALCECHYIFGYPKPVPRNSRDTTIPSLEDACADVIERAKLNS